MNIESLVAVGLSEPQAHAYALLMETGGIQPANAATELGTTRTNAYKVLDKLVEMRLAKKQDKNNKFFYEPANPMALTGLSAQLRSEAAAREEAVNSVIQDLLSKYHTHTDKPLIKTATGRKAVAEMYRKQIGLQEDISFIHTAADVPLMSFEVMHEIRTKPARQGNQRRGILGDPGISNPNMAQHKRSNLDVKRIAKDDYDAPVEWSVTDSSLLIVLYATEPHAIFIVDTVVAGAFTQLFNLIIRLLPESKV